MGVPKSPTRRRKSIDTLSRAELDMLVRAWHGIQQLPPTSDRSFSTIGGYHGEPFRGAGWGNATYWGGYCNHGNVLFPAWHRAYLLNLENALRSVEGCADVTLPYWDETSETTLKNGIPSVLTCPRYTFADKEEIPNPLYSYRLQNNIVDHRSTIPDANYSKPRGYETVRYPLSGLVGTDEDRKKTQEHNEKYLKDPALALCELNKNVKAWLNPKPEHPNPAIRYDVAKKYIDCLAAPNYTVFSNTTSSAAWADNNPPVVPLESPHNSMHLAVGGFDVPKAPPNFSPIRGANGDMGENETASFDPIFYLHHCFVDLVFWRWQQIHDATTKLEIMGQYPGTNSVDEQGATPGVLPNTWLDVNSPLTPFTKPDRTPYTSADVADITALGYDYEYEGLLASPIEELGPSPRTSRTIYVNGIDRTRISGSFLISAFASVGGESYHIGTEAVLSRRNVEGCANCQTHLRASAVFPLPDALLPEQGMLTAESDLAVTVRVTTHTPTTMETPQTLGWRDGVMSTLVSEASAETLAELPLYAEVRQTPGGA